MPEKEIIGWVNENNYERNPFNEIINEEIYDEHFETPTYLCCTVSIRGFQVKLGIDTGSSKTLISEVVFRELNADYQFELITPNVNLEAVNGSSIMNLGYCKIPVMFYGINKNYRGTFKFFVIRNLGVMGLLGLDELIRHKIGVDLIYGNCYQAKAGKLIMDVIFKEDSGVKAVYIAEETTLPPHSSCDIKVQIDNIKSNLVKEGIIYPRNDIWKWGVKANCTTTIAQPTVITQVLNLGDQSLILHKGDKFGQFVYTMGESIVVSSVVEEYAECTQPEIEIDDLEFENPDEKLLREQDFALSETKLNENEKNEIKDMLAGYLEVFQWDNRAVSVTNKIQHKIQLKDNVIPVKHKNRRYSPEQEKFIDKEVLKLLDQKIIQPSTSAWSSRVVLSWEERKGRWRLCLDYRDVNKRSLAPMAHPLPNIDQLLHQFRGNSWFHVLDLYQGYHQVPLAVESRSITAFATRKGLWEFCRMPFGLSSCPTTYQSLMETVLGQLHWYIAVCYIDDLIIFAKSYEEAKERLQLILVKLKGVGLKLRASKCRLFQNTVEFLGYVISEGGIKTCSHIVEGVKNFPEPKTVKQVQKFLGLSNYYRSFIQGHSSILAPVIELTRKGVPFKWTKECQVAMDTIKAKLISAPVRCYFDPEAPVILTTDASGYGIGCTLTQINEKGGMNLISYGSRALKPAERCWNVTEKELWSITFFVKKYSHFLSRPFLVYSDHHSLRFWGSMRDSSFKVSRWLSFLSQYTFEVHHFKGDSRELVVPDILSRIRVDTLEDKEEIRALKMERPILRLYKNEISPILMQWFQVEKAKEEDFDENNEFVGAEGGIGPKERTPQLQIILKRLQKEVDPEGQNL